MGKIEGKTSRKDKRRAEGRVIHLGSVSSAPARTASMHELLEKLLALPHDATDWNYVLHSCAQKGHSDLPTVFRRIAAAVPHTPETSMSYFYWAAAEEFTRRDFGALLPEVAAGYAKLDADSYDRKSRKGRVESQTHNLLDYLSPSEMEQRIARACPDVLGVSMAQAQILVDAHTVLLDFAVCHGLVTKNVEAATRTELERLRGVLAST